MGHCNQGRFLRQVSFLRAQFAQSAGLPLSEVLSREMLEQALRDWKIIWVECIYTPLVTLWVFLAQVLAADPSCRAAVARLTAHRVGCGERPCSANTGAYCLARKSLPEGFFAQLVRQAAEALRQRTDRQWRWKGREVYVFDGSTVSMPDTAANQAEYPQPRSQAQGVGFPLARIAAVFSLGCGAVLDLAICPMRGKGQSELGMLRQLWSRFARGSLLLADRGVCAYLELALLRQRGVDVVCRINARRRVDFRRGRSLGELDHVVAWRKPPCPAWMDWATYLALPEEMEMREIRIRVARQGFRVRIVTLATTLLDPEEFPLTELTELYRARWHAELDLRSLKETMRMDVLRCKTPDMVRKEIWTHLLAYNLIRTVMAQAGEHFGILPRTISFKGSLQFLQAFQPHLARSPYSQLPAMYLQLLEAVATHRVGNRPDRFEPRARKRRPKPYPMLRHPRHEARKRFCG
jgi:hypothetical protein